MQRPGTRTGVIAALLLTVAASSSPAAAAPASDAVPAAQRLTLRIGGGPPRAGHPITVVVGDRRGRGGVRATVCLRSGGTRTCRAARIPAGANATGLPWLLRATGPAIIDVSGPAGLHLSRTLSVRPSGGRLTLMTAGDSEIQSVDGFLANRVRPLGVRTFKDAQPGSKLSITTPLDWPVHAERFANAIRADVVVMEIGLNEGYPMNKPDGTPLPCCGAPWIAELARRARLLMASYIDAGATRVYWLLLPPPRGDGLKAIVGPVNAAWRLAARAYPAFVKLVDQGPLFPDGTPRSPDQLHLTATQDLRIARILAAQMQHDGVIPAGEITRASAAQAADDPPSPRPQLSDFAFAPQPLERGRTGTFSFLTTREGGASIVLARQAAGRRSAAGACVAATSAPKGAACLRSIPAGRLRFAVDAGEGRKRFDGRVNGRRLPAGRYRATLRVLNDAFGDSDPAVLTLRIAK